MSAKLVCVAAHLGMVVATQFLASNPAPAVDAGKQFLGVPPPSNAFQAIASAPRAEDIEMVARGTLSDPEWLEPRLEPKPESGAALLSEWLHVSQAASKQTMPIKSVKMSDDDLRGIERNIEQLVTSGQDPATRSAVKQLSATLVRTIIPIREEQMRIDQTQIDRLVGDIKYCSPEEKRRRHAELDERLSAVKEHKANYAEGVSDLGDCNYVQGAKDLVKDARCLSVPDPNTTCRCHSDITNAAGEAAECTGEDVIAPANKKCCDAYASLKLHQIKCQSAKHDMDYAHLQGKIITDKVCDDYSACYKKEVQGYKEAEKKVKVRDDQRSLKTLYSIKCLVAAFDKGKVSKEEAKACKEKEYAQLAVRYPEVPPKEACPSPQA